MTQYGNTQQQMFDRVAQALEVRVISSTLIQELWSGYGELCRVELASEKHSSVIVKHIKLPQPNKHPKGWLTDISHQRKLISYQVEVSWYQQYVNKNENTACPIPKSLFVEKSPNEILLVLEDLQTLGFDYLPQAVTNTEINTALRWLAHFHIQHLLQDPNAIPEGLWPCGTYWHLDTRPDELAVLNDQPLKLAAVKIDAALKQCPFQTIVHGDAKLANFVFSQDGKRVAAVDFQYVGKGCGMKDVIMLLSSAVPPEECEQRCPELLENYFTYLQKAVQLHNSNETNNPIDFHQLEKAWRALYCLAWADFHRFLKGWSPEHWKIHPYSEQLTQQALAQLQQA